ncbi:hypothetical protein [Agaribacterium sp. ZY112]|uniref:hypothetical protein n=1 Tax=Agaribacterium sp. ZY112 TaxID=3233574 RepID=UPI003523A176
MIERNQRDQYAQLLRDFLQGKINNFDYDDAYNEIDFESDEAINQIYCDVWHYYCDLRKHKLTDPGWGFDSKESRRVIIRFILFLHSNLEYEWPIASLKNTLLKILTLGAYPRQPAGHDKPTGDQSVWPFYRSSDYEQALSNPRFLNGHCI